MNTERFLKKWLSDSEFNSWKNPIKNYDKFYYENVAKNRSEYEKREVE